MRRKEEKLSHHPPLQGETRCLTWAQPGAATCLGRMREERANRVEREIPLQLQQDKVPAKKHTSSSSFALLREAKNNKQRHTAGADGFNSSLLTSSSSSPPAHPPTLSAGIQCWKRDAKRWSRALPQCQSHPLYSIPNIPGMGCDQALLLAPPHPSCQVTFVNTS